MLRAEPSPKQAVDVAIDYHERTKHHYNRYARSLGYLDWDTQPDPFRRFHGSPLFLLPFPEDMDSPPYEALYTEHIPPRPLNLAAISRFFECSLAISAWKDYKGSRWSLRCNPSSGNLHPTEGYLITGPVAGLCNQPAVFHYAPMEHGLELRHAFPMEHWEELTRDFPNPVAFAGLSSIFWREAWKYGERAFRYCQHDVGHALAALAFSAAALGWRAVHLEALGDEDVSVLLGLNHDDDFRDAEPEHPDLIVALVPADTSQLVPRALSRKSINRVAQGPWHGRANRLSPDRVDWEVIDAVAQATQKPRTEAPALSAVIPPVAPEDRRHACDKTARAIFLQRRSAVAFDGRTRVSRDDFYTMLHRTLPRPGTVPWDAMAPPALIHFGLFVHRVSGLESGVYFLFRDPAAEGRLRATMTREFLWARPPACPNGIPLYLLAPGHFDRVAAQVSCLQDIAGMGAFSLAMIAEFEAPLREHGAWCYRRLFWEAGMAGQVLYLEAEAAGLRSTGIGCYFDDPVHHLFGLEGRAFQSMYHFTIGGPVEDTRLTTIPPYTPQRRKQSGMAGG